MGATKVNLRDATRLRGLTTAAAFVLFLALGAATAAIGAALPALHMAFAVGDGARGLLVSCYNAGALVAIIVCGIRKHAITARRELAILIGLFLVGCAGIGLAPSWSILLVSATVAGSGYGGAVLHVNTAFTRGFGQRTLLMLLFVNATFGVGAVSGPFLIGMVAESDVRPVFLAIALVVLVALPAYRCADLAGPDDASPTDSGHSRAVPLRVLAPFLVLALFYAGLETGIGAWEATHLTWVGFTPSAAAQWVSLYWLGITVGRFIVPMIAQRPQRILPWCLLVATTATGAATLPAAAPLSYVVAGLALAAVFPTAIAWMAGLVPAVRQANALVLIASLAGSVTHPLLIGFVADASRPTAVPIALTCTGFIALLAVFWASRRSTQHPQRH